MTKPRRLKRWYTISEASEILGKHFEEPCSEQDVIHLISEGDLPVWWDATNRYAAPVYRACHYYADPTEHPLYQHLGADASPDQLMQLHQGGEDLVVYEDTVQVLSGFHQIDTTERTDAIVIYDGEKQARTEFAHGLLVFDNDGESLLKILRRRRDTAKFSVDARDYSNENEVPPRSELRIAASDIQAIINSGVTSDSEMEGKEVASQISNAERDKLLKQVAALAVLLAEKVSKYERGGRPNAKQIADAAAELVEALPDADSYGLGSSSIRESIAGGLKLITR